MDSTSSQDCPLALRVARENLVVRVEKIARREVHVHPGKRNQRRWVREGGRELGEEEMDGGRGGGFRK